MHRKSQKRKDSSTWAGSGNLTKIRPRGGKGSVEIRTNKEKNKGVSAPT